MSSIIHITHLLPTLSRGGAERMAVDLVSRLDRQRFAGDVVAMVGGGPLEEEIKAKGLAVTIFKKRTKLGLGVLRAIVGHLKERGPTILHAHLSGPEIWGTRAADAARVPVMIITVHNTDLDEPRWRLALRRRAWMRATLLVAVSQAVKRYLVDNGVPEERIRVISNGVDLGRFVPSGRVRSPRPVLSTVGRLEEQKGHETLLRALLKVTKPVELRIAGTGSKQKFIEKTIQKLGLADRVRLVGDVENMPAYLGDCDLFVFPSRWEGQGIALLEAAAMGLPIVASNVGGIPEVVRDGESARLVPPDDLEALATAINWMLDHQDEAARMGVAARQAAERFSLDRMVAEYSALYEELAAQVEGLKGTEKV